MPGSVEALVVELHNIVKCGCNTIMKIGCTSGQSPQESALLTSPMSAHLPVITARPGFGNPVRGAIRALNGVDGQT